MRGDSLGVDLEHVGQSKETKVLKVLVLILDKNAEFLDTELNGRGVVGDASDDRVDALIEERHGRRRLNERCEGLDKLLCQARLLGAEGRKELQNLNAHPVVLRRGQNLVQSGSEREIVAWVAAG